MKQAKFLQYLEFEKRFSKNTVLAYKNDIDQCRTYLEAKCGITDLVEVKHEHIRSWVVHLIQNGITTRSVNRKLSTLKTFFRYLQKRDLLEINPMSKVITPKTGKRLPVFVKKAHLNNLMENFEFESDLEGQRNRTILEVLYHTGMRRSELIGLTFANIDLSNQTIKVLGKGNKERLIPFGNSLAKLLKSYTVLRAEAFPANSADFVFLTRKGKKLYPKFVYNLVKKHLSQVTTVEQRSPHVLRHSFATHLSDNGADLNAIKELLGHASLAATQVYTHNSIEKLKRVYKQAHPKA